MVVKMRARRTAGPIQDIHTRISYIQIPETRKKTWGMGTLSSCGPGGRGGRPSKGMGHPTPKDVYKLLGVRGPTPKDVYKLLGV